MAQALYIQQELQETMKLEIESIKVVDLIFL